jgi:hypothetical protein
MHLCRTFLPIIFMSLCLSPGAVGQNPTKPELSMQGGRIFYEMATGSQHYAPSSPSQWSFRIGGGADAIFGNIYATGKYSISGIQHRREYDFPQSLVSFLRFGTGWVFQDRYGRRTVIPTVSAAHVSDRIIPDAGESVYLFDGWGVAPGAEIRYVVLNSFHPDLGTRSSVFWKTHFVQFEIHHAFSERSYTTAVLSYNMFFNGIQLTLFTEYNSLARGARGWMGGIEIGFSWLRFRER